jgi:hypothetical protein
MAEKRIREACELVAPVLRATAKRRRRDGDEHEGQRSRDLIAMIVVQSRVGRLAHTVLEGAVARG